MGNRGLERVQWAIDFAALAGLWSLSSIQIEKSSEWDAQALGVKVMVCTREKRVLGAGERRGQRVVAAWGLQQTAVGARGGGGGGCRRARLAGAAAAGLEFACVLELAVHLAGGAWPRERNAHHAVVGAACALCTKARESIKIHIYVYVVLKVW